MAETADRIAENEEEELRRRQREEEEAMEQMMLAQEAEQEAAEQQQNEEDAAVAGGGIDVDGDIRGVDGAVGADGMNDPNNLNFAGGGMGGDPMMGNMAGGGEGVYGTYAAPRRLSYTQTSFGAALALLVYALRTREQWYLALVYISSSKWAYVVLGNALIAACVGMFRLITGSLLNGLRLHEAEGLSDFFRWNVTETCLALTMFRSELSVGTGIYFLLLILAKCLHWVADLREGHLRMTEEAIVISPDDAYVLPGWPKIQTPHCKLYTLLLGLLILDMLAVKLCGQDILTHGPSVSILFAFEAAILLVSAWNNLILWHLHVLDGSMHYLHDHTSPTTHAHRWIHPWKENKATFMFAVELQAQAAKFLFYVSFFAIVLTYYGMPINLFREVYLSFQSLKQRLVAFAKYRRLMASMNKFPSLDHDDQLEQAGRTCIICRDEMTISDCKQLPGCGHVFHKSCLREWLVQQQSCPTCRGDIATMEREHQIRLARQAREEQEQEQQQEQEQEAEGQEQPQVEESTTTQQQQGSEPATPTAGVAALGVQSETKKHRPKQQKITIQSVDAVENSSIPAQSATEKKNPQQQALLPNYTGPTAQVVPPNMMPHQFMFPAIYKVVQESGAQVWINDGNFVIRNIPWGVMVLALEVHWRSDLGMMMLRLPDGGWVRDEDLIRVHTVLVGNSNQYQHQQQMQQFQQPIVPSTS